MHRIAVYPGSFDPVTNGHLDVIRRCAKVFDRVFIAILKNSAKTSLFNEDERLCLIRRVTQDIINVEAVGFDGLLVQFMKRMDAKVIVKGLRAVSDFEYEFQMAIINQKLDRDIETFFLTASPQYQFLSSSIVKEVARLGGSLTDMVPDTIIPDILAKCEYPTF